MRYGRALILIAVLYLTTSCVPTPKRVGTRGSIRPEALEFLAESPVVREDVLLHLGMPEEISQDEKIFDYKWIDSKEWNSLVVQSGSIEVQTCNILRIHFNGQGFLESWRKHSYKPKTLLRSNRQCRL